MIKNLNELRQDFRDVLELNNIRGYALSLEFNNLSRTIKTSAQFTQSDINTSVISVQLINEGAPIVLEKSTLVYVNVKRNDNTTCRNECTVLDGNTGAIVISFNQKSTEIVGATEFEVVIISKGNKKLLSPKVAYKVFESIDAFSEVPTPEDVKIVDIMLNEVVELKESVVVTNETIAREMIERNIIEANREKAEALRNSNEFTRDANEDIRIESELSRIEKEEARLKNEISRSQNEEVRKESETTRGYNETGRVDNEEIRLDNETIRANSESTRTTNELDRNSNESKRLKDETIRSNKEVERVEAEIVREDSEAFRVAAEVEREKKIIEFNTKLEEASSQLEDITQQKVDIGGVEQVGMGMLTQAVKLAITGGSVAIVGDEGVNLTNLVDNAVNGTKCSFIESKQYNIYNEATTTLNHQITTAGVVSENTSAKLSDYIRVKSGVSYTGNGTDTRSMAFFNDAKQYLSGIAKAPSGGKYTFTVPEGCYYVRITYTKTVTNILVCETTNYDEIYYPYNTEDIEIKRVINKFDTLNIKDNAITCEKAEFIEVGKNKLNSANSTDYYISASNGATVPSTTYRLSEFIKVEANTDYVISPRVRHFLGYDINKISIPLSYMSASTDNYTFNTDNTIEYIRFDYYTSEESTAQLEIGTTPTGYERYCYKIPKLLGTEPLNVLANKTILNFGDSIMAGDGNGGKGVGKLIASNNGMLVTDYSKGGATVWFDDVDNSSSDEQVKRQNIQYQVDQAIANVSSIDFALINGGTNDISVSAPLGEISDGFNDMLDKYTFSGGLELCFKNLKNKYPTTKIIFIRVHNMGSRSYSNQVLYGVRALEICKKWSVKVVDLFSDCGLNTNMSVYEQYTNNLDKTHPNQLGYDTFYLPLIVNTIKSLVAQ